MFCKSGQEQVTENFGNSGIEPRLPGSRARSPFTILPEKTFLHIKTMYHIMFCQVKTLQFSVCFNVFNNCRPLTSILYSDDEDGVGREPKQADVRSSV